MPRHTLSPRIHATASATNPLLVEVVWTQCLGVYFIYQGPEADILATGLIESPDLPGEKKGCHRRTDDFHVSRLLHGNVRLRVDADRVLAMTPGFKQFMGGLLADSRLSLVRNEVQS